MGGSLNHILGEDGKFTMELIDTTGDAHEALEQCFEIIVHLAEGDMHRVSAACRAARAVDPYRKNDRLSDEPMPAVMEGSKRYGTPWPLHEVLSRLINATEHSLYDVLDSDRDGHELDKAAVDAGRAFLRRWRHEEPPPPY